MPISCFQMHVIHLWYCHTTWCIFRKYVATVLCYCTFRAEVMMDDSNPREPVDWRLCMLCQESNISKGAVVLNPRTESYQKILDVVAERASVHDGHVAIQRRVKRMHRRNAGWQRINMASKLLFLCHKSDRIAASQRPLWTFSGHRAVCYEKARP